MSLADSLAHDPLRGEFEQVLDPSTDDDPRMMGASIPSASDAHPEPDPTSLGPAPADEEEDDDDLFGDGAEDADAGGELEATQATATAYADVDEQAGRGLSAEAGRDLDGLDEVERRKRKELEYEEGSEAEEEERVSMTTAEVYAPRLPRPREADGKYWLLHLPNYVQIDPKPFSPQTYVGPEMTDPEVLAATTPEAKAQKVQETSHFVQYQVKNALRWRWGLAPDGTPKKQANSRVVRWSDGSLSVQVGTEFWDVNQQPDDSLTARDTSFAVAQMPAAQINQAIRTLSGSMALRPTGLNSKTHRDLVRAIGQKHSKIAKLLMTHEEGGKAPEARWKELLKEDARAAAKARTRERAADGLGTPRRRRVGGGGGRRGRAAEEMWSDEEEEADYEEDEEEEEGGGGRKRARGSPRKSGAGQREGRRAGSYEEDDFVVKDSDEEGEGEEGDEEEESPRGRKRQRTSARGGGEKEEAGVKDEMDLAEERLESQRKDRKRARQSGAGEREEAHPALEGEGEVVDERDEPESEEMDEEDEDEDEEVGVRRAGAARGGRRRVLEDEEE